ncbi:MAG: hypothetical protein PHY15_01520 [Eubacteriales bacterium]|nr:hypothetical protein [Eubacteriales bacterium]
MKTQWTKFLNDNESIWSYNIVPSLVSALAAETDDSKIAALKQSLALQGVVVDGKGNLAFTLDIVLNGEPSEDLISLAEYAELHGKAQISVQQKARRGGFKTAKKVGRNWVISKDEPYTDLREKKDR